MRFSQKAKLLVVAVVAFVLGGIAAFSRDASAYFPADAGSGVIDTEVTCATTATQLPSKSALSFMVRVPEGGATTFVGGSGVTTAAGFPLYAKDAATYSLSNTNKLYCIVAAGTQKLKITGESR